jgi:putative ABC transport system permease protein
MIKNYVTVAWRNIIKNKASSFINISGLAVGMAVAMLIGLWIWDEVSYNKYHKNYDSIGQLMTTQTSNGVTQTFPSTVVPLSNELRFKYAGNFKHLALTSEGTHILTIGDTKISQTGMFAEPDMPAILSLVMIKGSYDTFKDPTSLLLSASVAKALFGNDEPINKLIRIDNDKTMKVAGIYQDLPHNTTFNQIAFMLPWNSPGNRWNTPSPTWDNHGCQLYVQLEANVNFDKISAQIRDITKPYFKINDETMQVFPMSKWHLYSEFQNGKSAGGRITFVRLFGTIGFFVLLLACINFMNLSTARSEKKAKEVGIRKAIGSLRSQLVKQFLSESILVVFLAFILTIVMVLLAIPYFNTIADKQVTLPWGNPLFWLVTFSFTVITGLLSGSYPAFYLSAFKPIKVLKGTFKVGRLAALPRKVLVVVQFTVSIVLIIGTIIVFRQIQFASNRPVGYSRAGLITVQMNTPQIYGHYQVMRNDLIQTGAVVNMAESNSATTQIWSNNSGFNWEGQAPGYNPSFGTIAVTTDFGSTVGWKIVEGRDFSSSFTADTGAFILNESAVKLSGIKNPIGKIMRWQGKEHVITGVVKDMVMESPYKSTVATIFHMQPDWVNLITIRINPKISMQTALNKIELIFKTYNPGSPFSYQFIDDEYAKKFSDEKRIGQLATVFAVLAIFISCLGLFGMASFMAEQRIKEIGVRKVLGASVFNLWRLLSKDFVVLVVISLLIATPVAYYLMHIWLQNYQFRTEIVWWIFSLTGLCAIVITLATVSYQSIKAALANPVKSLKME